MYLISFIYHFFIHILQYFEPEPLKNSSGSTTLLPGSKDDKVGNLGATIYCRMTDDTAIVELFPCTC